MKNAMNLSATVLRSSGFLSDICVAIGEGAWYADGRLHAGQIWTSTGTQIR